MQEIELTCNAANLLVVPVERLFEAMLLSG
jgi:hypothetical protein